MAPCPVCLEDPPVDAVTLDCAHQLCRACLNQLEDRSRPTPLSQRCPTCRRPLPRVARAYARAAAAVRATARPALTAPSLTRLTIAGGCRRAPTKARLNTERGRISKCFGAHSGSLEARVSLTEGVVTEVEKTSGGVTKGVDLCVLKVLEKSSYPPKGTCSIRLTWGREAVSNAVKSPSSMKVPTEPRALPGR